MCRIPLLVLLILGTISEVHSNDVIGDDGSDAPATESTTETSGLTTTVAPIEFASLGFTNNFQPEPAKLILQKAVQLENHITNLINRINEAFANTDPNNSPLYDQLSLIAKNVTEKNEALSKLMEKLNELSNTQTVLNNRINNASQIFTCFAESACVTDAPTTPAPTTLGPTPPAATCDQPDLTSSVNESEFSLSKTQNVDCNFHILSSDDKNNISLAINVIITGNGYLEITETRTDLSQIFNSTQNNGSMMVTSKANIHYFADPQSSISFTINYTEVTTCTKNCTSGGVCKTTLSGEQYCECPHCEYQGEFCETPIDPCQTKQKKNCGELNKTNGTSHPYGICYRNTCSDNCYSCECVKPISGNDLKCDIPTDPNWIEPVAPTSIPCTSTTVPVIATTKVIEENSNDD